MSATACLQVVVKHQRAAAANAEILDIIAKVTTAFLESRWAWPRRFETVSPSSYLLIDPDAAGIDPSEVQQLASKLQTRLFGVSDAGEVMLAAFEGTPEEVLRFSRLTPPICKLWSHPPMRQWAWPKRATTRPNATTRVSCR